MNKNEDDTIKWEESTLCHYIHWSFIGSTFFSKIQKKKKKKTDRNWTIGEILEKDIEDQEKDIDEQSKDIHLSTIHL